MTRKLDLTVRQITALCRAAKKVGCIPEITFGKIVVRLVPLDQAGSDAGDDAAAPDQITTLEQWDRHTSARPAKDAPPDNFGALDLSVRTVFADGCFWEFDEFRAHLSARPPNERELNALAALSAVGVRTPVSVDEIKIGQNTEDRLLARGYMHVLPHAKFPEHVGFYILTEAGLDAASSKS